MNFKIANLKEDYRILVEANKDAKEFWKMNDSNLNKLKEMIITSIETN